MEGFPGADRSNTGIWIEQKRQLTYMVNMELISTLQNVYISRFWKKKYLKSRMSTLTEFGDPASLPGDWNGCVVCGLSLGGVGSWLVVWTLIGSLLLSYTGGVMRSFFSMVIWLRSVEEVKVGSLEAELKGSGVSLGTESGRHIKAQTKWLTFCRWHFQIQFLEWKFVYFD